MSFNGPGGNTFYVLCSLLPLKIYQSSLPFDYLIKFDLIIHTYLPISDLYKLLCPSFRSYVYVHICPFITYINMFFIPVSCLFLLSSYISPLYQLSIYLISPLLYYL